MVSTLIIDDDPIVVSSLTAIIENAGYEVLATGHSGQEAITLYKTHLPDIVMLDIRMSEGDGIEAAKAIFKVNPSAVILLITTFEDKAYIQEALNIGCKGYILKQNIKGLLPAIKAVLSGHTVLDNTIIKTVAQPTVPNDNHPTKEELSDREWEIFELVADGLNNKEIAATLFLSEGTVRNYVSELLAKMDLRDRTQLAIRYYKKAQEE